MGVVGSVAMEGMGLATMLVCGTGQEGEPTNSAKIAMCVGQVRVAPSPARSTCSHFRVLIKSLWCKAWVLGDEVDMWIRLWSCDQGRATTTL